MPGITPFVKLLPFIAALSSGDAYMPSAYFWFAASTSGPSHARYSKAPITAHQGPLDQARAVRQAWDRRSMSDRSNKRHQTGSVKSRVATQPPAPEPDSLQRRPQDSHRQIGQWPWVIAACDILSHIFLRYGPMSLRSLDPDRQSGEAVDREAMISPEADPRSTSV